LTTGPLVRAGARPRLRVVLDACVLFPTVMREVLIGCADAGLYDPRWSARILEEWARATTKIGAEVVARGEVALLRARWPGAEVLVPDATLPRFWLPDPNDIHVLAAAVLGHADLIVTLNAQDFPRDLLQAEGLKRADPDGFLCDLYAQDPAAVRAVVDAVVAEACRLSGMVWTTRSLLKKAKLTRLAKALARE
jgi:predicted nucleic acid-binding protein